MGFDEVFGIVILPQFQTFETEAKLEAFVWSHQSIKLHI